MATSALVNLSMLPEEYHDFADVFSKSKAGKLADHRPYDLKITLDEGFKAPFCLLALFTPCPRRNLPLSASSLTRTLPQGSSVPHTPHVELWSFSSERKMVLFNFASTSKASTRSQRRIVIRFRSFPICSTHHKKHESTLKSTSGMHTIWFALQQETNGRPPSGLIMDPLSGW